MSTESDEFRVMNDELKSHGSPRRLDPTGSRGGMIDMGRWDKIPFTHCMKMLEKYEDSDENPAE
jgi:hypothetical protein